MAMKTINKMKRQLSEWEKIIANEATDKGLISKIYKQLIQLYIKKKKLHKWAENLNRHSYKENIPMANKYIKRCSTSLIIIEIQMETTIRYRLTSVRIATIKNLQTVNAGRDVEKRVPLCTVGRNID